MPHPPNRFNNIRVVSGQTKRLRVTVKDKDGRPAKLNQAEDIVMTAIDHDGEPVFTKHKGDGIEISDASKGQLMIELSSTDTALEAATYKYDLWIIYAGTPPVRDPVVKEADLVVTKSPSFP